jgi:hypothetical protein
MKSLAPGYRRCTLADVRTRTWLLVVIYPTLLSWACSDVTGVPTGPSAANPTPAAPAATTVVQDVPSLMGPWQASGTTTFRNLETGNVLNWGGCSGSFTITAQDGQRFSGLLHTQGGSFTSDRFCTASGTFTGELVERDGSVTRARLEGNFQNWPRPSVSPSCELIAAGDGVWTGSATRDAVRLQVRDMLRCAANVDGGFLGIPMADFERTVSFTFQR